MGNTNESNTVRLQWYEDQIEVFIEENPNKTYSLLLWNEDEFIIAEQLNEAIEKDVDIIFTEILPQNLPNICSNDEYNFLNIRYVRLKPRFLIESNYTGKEKKLIIDNKFKKRFLTNKIINNHLNKVFEEVLLFEDIDNNKINELFKKENVFIFTLDINILYLCANIFDNHRGNVYQYILKDNLFSYEILNFHLNVVIIDLDKSLRNFFINLIKPKTTVLKEIDKNKDKNIDSYSKSINITFENDLLEENEIIQIYGINKLLTVLANNIESFYRYEYTLCEYLIKTNALNDHKVTDSIINYFLVKGPKYIKSMLQNYANLNQIKITYLTTVIFKKLFSSIVLNNYFLTSENKDALIEFTNYFKINNTLSLQVQYYNFYIKNNKEGSEIVNASIKYLKENNNALIIKKLIIDTLFTNKTLSNDEFLLILNSNIFTAFELFCIMKCNYKIRHSNLNNILKNEKVIFLINNLNNFDESFFKKDYNGTMPDLLRILISQYLGIKTINKDHNLHTTLSKIYFQAYSNEIDNNVNNYEPNEIINSLKDFKEGTFKKSLFYSLNDNNNKDFVLLELIDKAKNYHDLRLIFTLAKYFSLSKTESRTKRLMRNYISFTEELSYFLDFSK